MSHLPAFALLALQSPAGGGMTLLLLQFGLIFAIFYFLVIRPQQRQRREHEERLRTLKRGDEIVTAGGIIGEIVHIGPVPEGRVLEDRVTIKSGESRFFVERVRIAKVLTAPAAAAASSKA